MADKPISGLTAKATADAGDLFVIEEADGDNRKVLAEDIGAASGTVFPGSPANGDRFWRSDRNIEYFYDGTRWLSTQIFTADLIPTDANLPYTATNAAHLARTVAPYYNTYGIYVERLDYFYVLVGTGNWTITIGDATGTLATLAGLTSTSTVLGSSTINLARTSTGVQYFLYTVTENSGTASLYFNGVITYRLVG